MRLKAKPLNSGVDIFICRLQRSGDRPCGYSSTLRPAFCLTQCYPAASGGDRYRFFITAFVFARDWLKGLFYRIRESAFLTTITVILLLAVVGAGSLDYLWRSSIWSTVCHNNGGCSVREAECETVLGMPFEEVLRVPGQLDNLPGPTHPTISWLFKGEGGVVVDFSSSPAVVNSLVYISAAQGSFFSSGGAVYCLDANSGTHLWRYDTSVQIFSSPTVVGGRVYVGEGFHQDADCHLHCLDASSGRRIWRFKTASHVESTPFISQGKVYFGAGNDGVYCLDALEGPGDLALSIHPCGCVASGMEGKGFTSAPVTVSIASMPLIANSGAGNLVKSVWITPLGGVQVPMVIRSFSVSATVTLLRVLKCQKDGSPPVMPKQGSKSGSMKPKIPSLQRSAYRNGSVYFGSRDGGVYALNATNGALGWKADIGHPVVSSPAVTEDSVYVGADNGVIYKIGVASGHVVWQFDTDRITGGGPIYSSPAIANGKLYIGLKDYLLCLEEEMIDEMLELDDQ